MNTSTSLSATCSADRRNRDERLDYQRIYRFAQTLDEDGYLVTATYHQRRHDMATPFYTALDAIGYDCVLTPYMEGWRTVKSQIAASLRDLNGSTDDVMFVGGDSFSGEITDALRDLRTRPDGTPRRVVVAHFDKQTEFHASEFETLDLVRDVGALPVRTYEAAASTDAYPPGYPQPGAQTEAPSPLASALKDALVDAPEDLLRKAPEPAVSTAPVGAPRPQLVLIDHENIDWTLGTMIEPLRLDEQTRPRWEAIQALRHQPRKRRASVDQVVSPGQRPAHRLRPVPAQRARHRADHPRPRR